MITMRIINSNGGAMELAVAENGGIDIMDVLEPSRQNVDTLKKNFSGLNVKHRYIGEELANSLDKPDVYYINTAKKEYSAAESSVPIVDKNVAGAGGNGVLVMKNAFRLVSLQEPDMFVIETGLKIHAAASEAFASLPRYYIRQLVFRDASKCGHPMKKRKSFLIGTKKDFSLSWSEREPAPLTNFLEKGVDYGELPAYALNRINRDAKSFPSVIIDPSVDSVVPNITGHYAKDDSEVLVKDEATGKLRPFTATEIARFYGFPDEYQFIGSGRQKIQQITDSVGVGYASFIVRDVIKHYFNNCYSSVLA